MKMRSQCDKQTELISASKADSYQQKLAFHLQQIGELVINALFADPEFKIWKSKDRQGNVWWYPYDIMSGKLPIVNQPIQTTNKNWLNHKQN